MQARKLFSFKCFFRAPFVVYLYFFFIFSFEELLLYFHLPQWRKVPDTNYARARQTSCFGNCRNDALIVLFSFVLDLLLLPLELLEKTFPETRVHSKRKNFDCMPNEWSQVLVFINSEVSFNTFIFKLEINIPKRIIVAWMDFMEWKAFPSCIGRYVESKLLRSKNA